MQSFNFSNIFYFRSHSSYYYRNPRASVESFEPLVYKSIFTIKDCFSNKSEIDCLIDSNFMQTYQVSHLAKFFAADTR